MPWEPLIQQNTLLVERRMSGNGRYEYKLHPFFRRNDLQLGTFLAPLSLLAFENSQLVFTSLEFLDTPHGTDASHDGDTYLTTSDYYQQLSLTSLVA